MKNIYAVLLSSLSAVTFAQQTISFEAAEGYQLGSIHNQAGWQVTEGSDGFITNQVISNEKSTTGTFSFKNAFEPDFEDQWFPIMGAVKDFAQPMPFANFTISYDVMATAKLGSDFEFTIYGVDANEEFVPVAGVGIENRGFIYLITDENYSFEYATAQWTPNQWVNVKIEVTAATLKYYINNALQLTTPNFSSLNISGFNMLHNNYGNDAYYDNFVVTDGTMGTNRPGEDAVALYPSPAEDVLSIQLPANAEVGHVEIYAMNGQKVIESTSSNINVQNLAPGMYIAKISSEDGSSLSKKFLKK